jgi:hypothetical protein
MKRDKIMDLVKDLVHFNVEGFLQTCTKEDNSAIETLQTCFINTIAKCTCELDATFNMSSFLNLAPENYNSLLCKMVLKVLPMIFRFSSNINLNVFTAVHELNNFSQPFHEDKNEILNFLWNFLSSFCQLHLQNSLPEQLIPDGLIYITSNCQLLLSIIQPYQTYSKHIGGKIDAITDFVCSLHEVKIESLNVNPALQKYLVFLRSIVQLLYKGYNEMNENVFSRDQIQSLSNSKELRSLCQLFLINIFMSEQLKMIIEKFNSVESDISKHLLFKTQDNDNCISLIELMRKYNVTLPSELLKEIQSLTQLSEGFSLNSHVPLKSLQCLLKQLDDYLLPLHDLRPFLIHFHVSESMLFSSYMKFKNNGESLNIEEFCGILQNAYVHIQNILKGSANLLEIKASNLNLIDSTTNVSIEFQKAEAFFTSRMQRKSNAFEYYKNVITLLKLQPSIKSSIKVCEMFQLEGCLQSDSFTNLETLYLNLSDESYWLNLQLKEASELLLSLFSWFGTDDELVVEDWQYLNIIEALADSGDFYQFLVDMNFVGDGGQAHFQQQFRLVTQQLQGEEYQQEVLSHLSIAYKFVVSFTEFTGNFKDFFKLANSCDTTGILSVLKNINRNIDSLQLWFSRIEEDTVEKISSDLSCICSTGTFLITALSSHISLQFLSSDKSTVWNIERIQDYVRKLAFLNPGSKDEEMETFLFYYEMADKLHSSIKCLCMYGHPKYAKADYQCNLCCFENRDKVSQEIDEIQSHYHDWVQKAAKLREEYPWLILFNTTEISNIYNVLNVRSRSLRNHAKKVQKEIDVLNVNLVSIEKTLQKFNTIKSTLQPAEANKWTGSFLKMLYESDNSSPIPHYDIPKENRGYAYLHKAFEGGSKNLTRLIFSIFTNMPVYFQIFRCKSNTEKEEIARICQCISKFPGQYAFIEVNKLKLDVQEELIKCYLKLHFEWSKNNNSFEVHFIETDVSIFDENPWITSYVSLF